MVLSIYPSQSPQTFPLCICGILVAQWIVSPHWTSLTFIFQTKTDGYSLIRLHKKSDDDAVFSKLRLTTFGKVVKF